MRIKWLVTWLLVLASVVSLCAETGDKEKYSTKKIDVAVKDEDGYLHYVVFEKVKTPGEAGANYSVAFYVNDQIQLRPGEVWSLVFRTQDQNYAGKLLFSDGRGLYARVLHFELSESSLRELARKKGIGVRILFPTADIGNFRFNDYTVESEASLRKAMAAVLDVGE
jgi:hypothetical protein